MNPMEEAKTLITSAIEDAYVEVTDLTGTADHLGILIVSDVFKGKLLIDQHQLIMDILKESLKERIHAVQLKTMTKAKFERTKA
jgi:stress-induced morphogen